MTTEQIRKYFDEIGYQPTDAQMRCLESMNVIGERVGRELSKSFSEAFSPVLRLRRYRS